MENNLINIFFVPEVSLAILAIACLMYGLFSKNNSFNKATNFATLSLIFISFLVYFDFTTNFALFENFFSNTAFTKFFKILTILGAAASLIISKNYFIDTKINRFEIPTLLLFSTLGMMLMISSKNLMMMYLAIELQSLSLYVVASIKRNSLESAESGVKYFILGALSSGILLYGFSLVYGFTGQTSFDGIYISLSQLDKLPIGLVFGLVFILVGLAFKVSAVPFHMWTPDVYEGAPTSITAFFAIVPKLAAIALIFRFCLEPFNNFYFEWSQVIFFLSLASMFLGAIAAIAQKSIKRLLAYSSIGHVGYVLIALVAASDQGIRSVSIYMFIYLIMNVSVFAILLSLKKSDKYVEKIDQLSGLSKTNPVVSVSLAIIMLSMAGIPPFIGFFGKFYIFIAAIESQQYILAILGVLASVISAFYYLRIIKGMYFDEAIEGENFDFTINNQAKAILLILLFIITFFIFYPSLLTGIVSGISLI
ncbi:MAG: NADH-quinone oxidoreductase subunit NuoN [Proteobacteria bacterium]|nr:NADH-quinone oxidoreductase subunit NuoN [Alphaproteobacteria bacterium]MDA0968659.1 NADH-quinone oxidoreductase subunit NuoN [Pseudomonadota bacterium]MDA1181448.1 NADH-quinone oxidoreductase subunit NuoN [Pseudomonadota bacterium]